MSIIKLPYIKPETTAHKRSNNIGQLPNQYDIKRIICLVSVVTRRATGQLLQAHTEFVNILIIFSFCFDQLEYLYTRSRCYIGLIIRYRQKQGKREDLTLAEDIGV